MQKVVCFALVVALSACTTYVPVKQDTSKNDRLQTDLDATLALRTGFRQQLRQTTDPDTKAAIATRIQGLNSDIVSIKVAMGYPASAPDPVDPDVISVAEKAQQDIEYWEVKRTAAVGQLKVYPDPSQRSLREDIDVIDRRITVLKRRLNNGSDGSRMASNGNEYGTVIDNQGIDQSSPGTTGGAMVGSALGSAAYIDRAFRPGNNYSAVAQVGAGLLGALLGAQLDRRPVSQYHFRYALRQRDGEIVSSDSVQQDAFRHPIGMCLRIADLQPVSQSLCGP